MKRKRRFKCKCCNSLYRPDPRSEYHQAYCSLPACRKASKAASQRKWLNKPENRGYFCGPEQVRRVQRYWATHRRGPRKKRDEPGALQEKIITQPVVIKEDKPCFIPAALQDDFLAQPSVLLGIIYSLTGSSLQEDMARQIQQYHTRGQMIQGMVPGTYGEKRYDREASVEIGTVAQGP